MFARSCLAGYLFFAGTALPQLTIAADPVAPRIGDQFESLAPTGTIKLQVGRQKLLRTQAKVKRTAVVDAQVCNVAVFASGEISLLGRAAGETQVTFWYDDPTMAPLTWVVEVK